MIGGGSDAESSNSEGAPARARIVARPQEVFRTRTSGRRGKKSVQACVEAGLLNYSSEDEVPPTAASSAGGMEENPSQTEVGVEGEAAGSATQNSTGSSAAPPPRSVSEKIQALRERNNARKRKGAAGNDADTEESEAKLFLKAVKEAEKKKQVENRVIRRRAPEEIKLKKGGKTKVILEKAEGEEDGDGDGTPEKSSDGPTPMKEARHRIRGPGGKGGGKGKSKRPDDSDSEASLDDSTKQAWEEDLESRKDRGSKKLVTAYSIKLCKGAAIRTLSAESFLGGRRLEEGGHLLFDTEGKVNVHFMLGTHRMAQKVKEKRKRGDATADGLDKEDAAYLKWLMVRALELRAITKGEAKRGVINQQRIKVAQKTCRWSLAASANLAQHSGDEKDDAQGESPELIFKAQSRSDTTKTDNKECRQLFRSQVAEKQAKITVASTHNADLDKVQDLLTAPSFSFDWEAKADDDEDDLEVDVPEEEKATSRRDFFRDQLRRSVSFNQAKKLSWRDRGKSGSTDSLPGPTSAPSTPGFAGDIAAPASTDQEWVMTEVLSRATASQGSTAPSTGSQQVPATAAAAPEEEPGAAPAAAAAREDEMEASHLEAVQVDSVEVRGLSAEQEALLGSEPAAEAAIATPVRAAATAEDAEEVRDAMLTEEQEQQSPPAARQLLSQLQGVSCDSPRAVMSDDVVGDQAKVESDLGAPSTQGAAAQSSSAASFTQDWTGITPTAMWSCSDKHEADGEMAAAAVGSEGLERVKRPVEISPTLPCVPSKIAHDSSRQPVEISPTLAFVPNVRAEPEPQMPAEISPTLPFDPLQRPAQQPVEISPTLPFEPRLAVQQQSGAAAEESAVLKVPEKENQNLANVELNGSIGSNAEKNGKDVDVPLKPADNDDATKSGLKRLHHEASLFESDDSLSEDSATEAMDVNQEGLSQAEMVLQQDAKQRRQERLWLKHKRKAARREEQEKLRREISSAKARKRSDDLAQAPWLGTASGTLAHKAAMPEQSVGLTRLTGAGNGSDLLSEFGSALQKKKSFLRR